MTRLEIWTGEKVYMTPIGTIQTPEFVADRYPAANLAFSDALVQKYNSLLEVERVYSDTVAEIARKRDSEKSISFLQADNLFTEAQQQKQIQHNEITQNYQSAVVEGLQTGPVYIIETDDDGQVALSEPMNLSMLRGHYKIDSSLSTQEAIVAIEAIMNAPPPVPEPDPSERIAAALEFQNAVTMLDIGLAIEPSLVAKNYERKLWSAEQAVLALGEAAKEIGVLKEDYDKIVQVLETKEEAIKGAE